MRTIKEKTLFYILLIIIILIIGITAIFIINKRNINTKDNEISICGKWNVKSSYLVLNDEIRTLLGDFSDSYIIINEDDIDICYYLNNNLECYKSNYMIDNNSIIINGITAYLPVKSEYYLENGFLILRERNNAIQYTEMIFERE